MQKTRFLSAFMLFFLPSATAHKAQQEKDSSETDSESNFDKVSVRVVCLKFIFL